MGWINSKEQLPPEGLQVLVEASGQFDSCYSSFADHDFFIATWIKPEREEGFWNIYDSTKPLIHEKESHLINPTIFAWMPLPEHYQPKEMFGEPDDDLFEHAQFESDPDYLYKGEYNYEQMSLDDFLKGAGRIERGTG